MANSRKSPDTAVLTDAEVRREAIDPSRSFLVEAPAGSGKTELLIQRILRLLVTVGEPEEIVAITFTRKAATEMRDRVLEAIRDASLHAAALLRGDEEAARDIERRYVETTLDLARDVLAHEKEHGWNVLASPSRLRIQTIDAFHGFLVRRLPFLSRAGGYAAVADDARDLYLAAVRAVLDRSPSEPRLAGHVQRLLMHLDNNRGVLEGMFVFLIGTREKWSDIFEPSMDDPSGMLRMLEQALEHTLTDALLALDRSVGPVLRAQLPPLARYASRQISESYPDKLRPGLASWLERDTMPRTDLADRSPWEGIAELLLTDEGEYRRRVDARCGFPAGKGAAADMKQHVTALLDELRGEDGFRDQLTALRNLPETQYEPWEHAILESILTVLREALAALTEEFRARDLCDHPFIAESARAAIGTADDPTDFMLALDYQIRHILVDEFQDTSVSQKRLLDTLTAGWTEGDGRTIFLVGDPMQSIYRFREADVSLFIQLKERGFDSVRLHHLRLTRNFRSQAALVDWFNEAFPSIFPAEDDLATGAVAYQATEATKPALPMPAVNVVPCFEGLTTDEAEACARIITELRALPHPSPGVRGVWNPAIAILFRSRSHIAGIVQTLNRLGISYQAVDVDSLGDRQEVRDLAALTRALQHPADRLSWLAVLRAPWCGLQLGDLHALVHSDAVTPVPVLLQQSDRLSSLSADGALRLRRVAPILDRWCAHAGRMPLRRLVESAWQELGGPAGSTDEELRNAAIFFDLLDELDDGGMISSFKTLEERTAGLYAQPDPNGDPNVQLMSIHKAKGLQFDVVIIPGTGKYAMRDAQQLFVFDRSLRHGVPDDILFSVLSPRGSNETRTYAHVVRRNRLKADHELSRLLYVAMTRARHKVFLLCTPSVSKGSQTKPPSLIRRKDTFLGKVWDVADVREPLEAMLDAYVASGRTVVLQDEPVTPPVNILSRFRADWHPPAPPPAAIRTTPEPKAPTMVHQQERTSLYHVDDRARIIGVVIHRLLQRIAIQGPDRWPTGRLRSVTAAIRLMLSDEGLSETDAELAVATVVRSVENALADPRGRWILEPRAEARNEFALTTLVDGKPVSMIIDRTFIDENGDRWIIDYKTGHPGDGDPAGFVEDKAIEYAEQMEQYVRAGAALWGGTIRVGLFFPSLPAWKELDRTNIVAP